MTDFQNNLLIFFNEGKARFFEREIDNVMSGISERNLCGRLATYLEFLLEKHSLKDYFSDTEYNRKQNGEVKTMLDDNMEVVTINCDIIVHSRGKNMGNDNLIAIEMKKTSRPEHEKTSDRNRLRALTKSSFDGVWSYDGKVHPKHVCGYELGIYIELDNETRNCIIEGYIKGEKEFEVRQAF